MVRTKIAFRPGHYLRSLGEASRDHGAHPSPAPPYCPLGLRRDELPGFRAGFVPPSADIAVGPDFVVETINSQIQFYDKATGAALLPNTPLSTFFTRPAVRYLSSPVVTYDDIAGRFIVAAIALNSGLQPLEQLPPRRLQR